MNLLSTLCWIAVFLLSWLLALLVGFLTGIEAGHILGLMALLGTIHNWVHKRDRIQGRKNHPTPTGKNRVS